MTRLRPTISLRRPLSRAWTSKSKIRTETVKAYLFTIARNLYLEGQRKAQRQVAMVSEYVDPAPRPEKVVEERLDLQAVLGTIQDLPEVDRAVFLLRVQHQLAYAEIGRMMELSVSAAKVKVHRVRLKLAALHLDEGVER